MPPRRADLSTATTGRAAYPDVLPERYADENFMLCDADQFTAGFLDVSNMFQHLRAKHAVEAVVGEVEVGCISRNGNDAWMYEGRFV
jgi:hypothetical protein